MAEGDGLVLNNFKEQVLLGELDLIDDTIKVALIDNGWTPTIDGDVQYSTVSANELSGTGYVAGGETLSNKTVTQNDTNDRAEFDNTVDTTWTGLDAGTPNRAFLYDDTHASKWGIAIWEVTTPSNGGDYTLQWNAIGIIVLT